MKAKKDRLRDWELLEKKWQIQLETKEESLPEGIWTKIEERLEKQEGNSKKVISFPYSTRWIAAASVLLVLFGLMYQYGVDKNEEQIGSKGNEVIEKGVEISEKGSQFTVVPASSRNKPNFNSLSSDFTKPTVKKVQMEKLEESDVPTFTQKEIFLPSLNSEEALAQSTVQTDKIEEKLGEKSVEIMGQKEEVEEIVVVVDIEPIKKEKGFKKVIGFIQKMKSGKILDLTTRNRKGKLNEGIHQVMYQIEEKEEKLKNVLSL